MLKAKGLSFGWFIVLAVGILFVNPGMAAEKPFYSGKFVEIIVATKTGGGFDTDARVLAPYLQKELPGSTVIVRNVPGGGHIVGTNRVWHSRPNGLTIGFSNIPGLIASTIRGEEGIQFDLRKFTWLGRLYSKHRMLIARKNAGFDTVEALMKDEKEFKIGAAGVGDGPYNTALLTTNSLGLKKVRMIPNFGGGEEVYAIMRKEIEGVVGTLESFGALMDQGLATPLVIYDLKRWSRLPNVPTLMELVKSEKGKAVATYLSSEGELVRAIYTSPNTPADITRTLRTAVMKAIQHEEFKKTITQMKMEPFDFLPGEEVGKMVAASLNMPADVAALIKEVAKEQ